MTRGDRRLAKTVHFSLLIIMVAAGRCAAQNAPQVTKVEPPGWWANHSINPVRVLIRGENLSGATVHAVGVGLSAGPAKVNSSGTYLFVDVRLTPQAKAGTRVLRIATPRGSVEAPF